MTWRFKAALWLEWMAARLRGDPWRQAVQLSDRAHQAQQLLDNAMLKEAFNALDAAYVEAWRASPPGAEGAAAREALFRCTAAVAQVRAHLQAALMTGAAPETGQLRRLATAANRHDSRRTESNR